jgi:hypothetical protein
VAAGEWSPGRLAFAWARANGSDVGAHRCGLPFMVAYMEILDSPLDLQACELTERNGVALPRRWAMA